jgi:hypothetical protein
MLWSFSAACKARTFIFKGLSARLKSCPVTMPAPKEYFPQPVKPEPSKLGGSGMTKVKPWRVFATPPGYSAGCEVVALLQSLCERSFSAACKARTFIIKRLIGTTDVAPFHDCPRIEFSSSVVFTSF